MKKFQALYLLLIVGILAVACSAGVTTTSDGQDQIADDDIIPKVKDDKSDTDNDNDDNDNNDGGNNNAGNSNNQGASLSNLKFSLIHKDLLKFDNLTSYESQLLQDQKSYEVYLGKQLGIEYEKLARVDFAAHDVLAILTIADSQVSKIEYSNQKYTVHIDTKVDCFTGKVRQFLLVLVPKQASKLDTLAKAQIELEQTRICADNEKVEFRTLFHGSVQESKLSDGLYFASNAEEYKKYLQYITPSSLKIGFQRARFPDERVIILLSSFSEIKIVSITREAKITKQDVLPTCKLVADEVPVLMDKAEVVYNHAHAIAIPAAACGEIIRVKASE